MASGDFSFFFRANRANFRTQAWLQAIHKVFKWAGLKNSSPQASLATYSQSLADNAKNLGARKFDALIFHSFLNFFS